MKISILYENSILDNKGGCPNYIQSVFDARDLYDVAAACCRNHIAVGIFNDNYRKGDNWRESHFIAVDFDDGKLSVDAIHARLTSANLNHVILASKNHLIDKGDGNGAIERFHIFIPLSEPIIDPSLYGFIAVNLCGKFGWYPDSATTKDKCRYYFKHRDALHIFEDGMGLNVVDFTRQKLKHDRIMAEKVRLELAEQKLFANKSKESSAIDKFKRTKYYKILERGELNQDGSRYGNSNSILGAMKLCGLNSSEALSFFDQFATYGRGFTRDSIELRFNKWR